MGFLKRDGDDPGQAAQQSQAGAVTDAAPHAGTYTSGSTAGIPTSGLERIARMKKEVARGFFTSDLSVNEFLLVREAGFRPLGLVLGSSIYHVGLQIGRWGKRWES
jgi:hypothetical protein